MPGATFGTQAASSLNASPTSVEAFGNLKTLPQSFMRVILSSQPFRPPRLLYAAKLVRPFCGGTQSALIECDDGLLYVLKMRDNPQGPNTLANEFLGTTLLLSLGLPVPPLVFVAIRNSFLKANPSFLYISKKGTFYPRAEGLHLGTKFMGDSPEGYRALTYLSPSMVNSVSNRSLFLAMYIFDVWANHQDHRQAVFVRNPVTRLLHATFIDNGHLFGGPDGSANRTSPYMVLHLEPLVYAGLWKRTTVSTWSRRIKAKLPAALSRGIRWTPADWYQGDLKTLQSRLLDRLDCLEQLVESQSLENLPFQPSSPASHLVHRIGTLLA